MKIEQKRWTETKGWQETSPNASVTGPQLVLACGARQLLAQDGHYEALRQNYSGAHILMLSTAGEILGDEVTDNTIAVTAIQFEKTTLQFAITEVRNAPESHDAGKRLAEQLPKEGLVHVMVFSDGLLVNGTGLVAGITELLPKTVSVTGGLVGDGSEFKETLVGFDGKPETGKAVIIGFYGEQLRVGYGSVGGWDTFGPERLITKSKDNVLYELDGQPALSLYKQYLGDQAKDLPSSGLLFPLSIRVKNPDGTDVDIVRTVLGVNEEDQSMTFAGDLPEGIYAKLMKANFERLIDGAAGAASMSLEPLASQQPELAILISCVGRKLVLQERIEEEIEAVHDVVGQGAVLAGFYSYGELCPTAATEKQCQLHNQTMTITTLREI